MSTPQNITPSDEIDLRELACTLWQRKGVIIGITAVCTAFAAAYAYTATPVYQTSVSLLPPPASALIEFNAQAQEVGLPPGTWNRPRLAPTAGQRSLMSGERATILTPEDAHELLISHLQSTKLQQQFLQQVTKNANLAPAAPLTFAVNQPTSLNERQSTRLTLQSKQADHLVELTSQYMQLANQAAQHELSLGLNAGLKVKQQQLRQQLKIAQAVNKALPSDQQNKTELTASLSLQAQLNQLEQTPDIALAVPLYAIDAPALTPTAPIKPKKKLVIVLGLVVGGILGSFLVLLQQAFRRPDNHH